MGLLWLGLQQPRPPRRPSSLLPQPSSDPGFPHFPLILLSCPKPKPPHAPALPGAASISRSSACHTRLPCSLSCRPRPPVCWGLVHSLAPVHFSPFLSLHALPSRPAVFLPRPLSCSVPLPLSAWPFLQGSLHLAHLSLPSSLRVSGAAPGASAPAPAPSLSLLSWKVQSPGSWVGGEAGVCCELLRLAWPSVPASSGLPPRVWALEHECGAGFRLGLTPSQTCLGFWSTSEAEAFTSSQTCLGFGARVWPWLPPRPHCLSDLRALSGLCGGWSGALSSPRIVPMALMAGGGSVPALMVCRGGGGGEGFTNALGPRSRGARVLC